MRRTVFKSAITGRFVTEAYAEANPATTFRQTLAPWRWIARIRARHAETR